MTIDERTRRRVIELAFEALRDNVTIVDYDAGLLVTPDSMDVESAANGRPLAEGARIRVDERHVTVLVIGFPIWEAKP